MRELSLLIGNGFNRLEDKSFPDWDTLIKLPVIEDQNFVDVKSMPYPLKFEYIANYLNQKEQLCSYKTYEKIKTIISKRLNDSILRNDKAIDVEIADLLLKIRPHNILTTNYDYLLEKAFISKKGKAEYSSLFVERNREKELFLSRTRWLGPNENKTSFYHVHGLDCVPKSICLGYEHYMRIITVLRNRLIGAPNGKIRIIEYLNDRNRLGNDFPNEYETKFFDSDIYIIGLGLTSQEVDLWWLLCYRAYLYFANIENSKNLIKNRIVYLDVHPIRITSDGYSYEDDYQKQQKSLFANMNVDYVPFVVTNQDFKSKYVEALGFIKACVE